MEAVLVVAKAVELLTTPRNKFYTSWRIGSVCTPYVIQMPLGNSESVKYGWVKFGLAHVVRDHPAIIFCVRSFTVIFCSGTLGPQQPTGYQQIRLHQMV
jgi:hypothetical protein